MNIEAADERDSQWEDWSPKFRVFMYTLLPTATGDWEPASGFDVWDVSDADLLEVTQFADDLKQANQTYSTALVVDGDRELPNTRGLVWLTGYDLYDEPSTLAQARSRAVMIDRLSKKS